MSSDDIISEDDSIESTVIEITDDAVAVAVAAHVTKDTDAVADEFDTAKAPGMAQQGSHWIVVINNFTPTDQKAFHENQDKFLYYVYGKEFGKKEATPHLQCYVVFLKKPKFGAVKKIFPRAWIHGKSRFSTPLQCSAYCKKDGEFTEWGHLPAPVIDNLKGDSNKYADAIKLAREGRFEEIEPEMFIKYYNVLKKINEEFQLLKQIDDLDYHDKPNRWYWGKAGAGKSKRARADAAAEEVNVYAKGINTWWDGYKEGDYALIEDYDKEKASKVLAGSLKRWADVYPFMAEVKHGTKKIRPPVVIVTSNWHPKYIWPNEPGMLEPILRRFEVIEVFHKKLQPEQYEADWDTRSAEFHYMKENAREHALEKSKKRKRDIENGPHFNDDCSRCFVRPCACVKPGTIKIEEDVPQNGNMIIIDDDEM